MKFTATEVEVGRTYYSETLAGDEGNYHWEARVSVTASSRDGGYVRIDQRTDGGKIEVVLLSPSQWKQIAAFVMNGPSYRDEA